LGKEHIYPHVWTERCRRISDKFFYEVGANNIQRPCIAFLACLCPRGLIILYPPAPDVALPNYLPNYLR